MGEVMAIESIVAEYAKFCGYFVEIRAPFRTEKQGSTKRGGISDIDVVGLKVSGRTKEALLVECKACGTAKSYPKHDAQGRQKYIKSLFDKLIRGWEKFIKNKNDTNKWIKSLKKIDRLNLWVVFGGYFHAENTKDALEKTVKKKLHKRHGNIKEIKIIPIHELLLELLKEVKKDKDKRGKRYDNAALEFCRWLLRGYENDCINLIDIDIKLKGKEPDYNSLPERYVKDCLRAIKKNLEKRKKRKRNKIEYTQNFI